LGPILDLARGVRNIAATAIMLFICTFALSSYVRPLPASPDLVAVPVAIIVGSPTVVTGNVAGVAVIVEVTNRGTLASVARNWLLKARVDDAVYDSKQIRIPPSFSLNTVNHAKVIFHQQDALYNKAGTPIQPGGSVTGIAAFNFEHVPIDVFLNRRTIFTISFVDALDREYNIETPLKPVNDSEINFYPGLTMEVVPQ
jgi:hypothetical protein